MTLFSRIRNTAFALAMVPFLVTALVGVIIVMGANRE